MSRRFVYIKSGCTYFGSITLHLRLDYSSPKLIDEKPRPKEYFDTNSQRLTEGMASSLL
jgi:hypothetical protein